MKHLIQFILLIIVPSLSCATQLQHPVTVTGTYSLEITDPRFEGQFYKFEITLAHGGYTGTIERPIVEYVTDGATTSEVVTMSIETIEGQWSLDMKTIVIDFPHTQNPKEIKAKSSNRFKVKLEI